MNTDNTAHQLNAVLDWLYDDKQPINFRSLTIYGIRDFYTRTGYFTDNQARTIRNTVIKYRIKV